MAHKIYGADLGAHTVKVAVIDARFRKLSLVDLRQQPVPPGDEPLALRAARVLGAMTSDRDPAQDALHVAFPGDALSLRMLHFPFSDPRKLEQSVGYELEGQIPFEVEDLHFAHSVVKSTPQGTQLLVAAVRKQRLTEFLAMLAEVGLEGRGITPSPAAYLPLCVAAPDWEGAQAVVDIGQQRTQLCVVRGERLLFARSLRHGGQQVTAALARAFGMTEEEAEAGKQDPRCAPFGRPEVAQVVGQALAPLCSEIRQSLAACRLETGELPAAVRLCGGGARLRGLAPFLSAQLSLRCELLDLRSLPIAATGISLEPLASLEDLLPFAQAIALGIAAGRGRAALDLRRGEFAFRSRYSLLRAKAPQLVAALLVILLLAALDAYAALAKLRKQRLELDARLRTATTELFGEARGDARAVLREIEQGTKPTEAPFPEITAFDLLQEISQRMPPKDKAKLDITELDIRPRKTFLKGTVNSVAAVDEIAKALSEMECVDDIQKGRISSLSGGGEEKEFSLTLTTHCP